MKKLSLLVAVLISAFPLAAFSSQYDRPGFETEIEDGRLWVFREGSKELEEFKKTGEPAVQFNNIGAGPDGMTVKSPSEETLNEYLKAIK